MAYYQRGGDLPSQAFRLRPLFGGPAFLNDRRSSPEKRILTLSAVLKKGNGLSGWMMYAYMVQRCTPRKRAASRTEYVPSGTIFQNNLRKSM